MARRYPPRGHSIGGISDDTYARSMLAAKTAGKTLPEWTEAAMIAALARQRADMREAQYRRACEDAATNRRPTPTRDEFFSGRKP